MKFNMQIETAIEALEKNLNEHVTELKEATAGWTTEMIEALNKFRDAVDRRGLEASHVEIYNLLHSRPVDTRAKYSKYLSAMKRAQADGQSHVAVDEDDHDRIYNDNWEWRVSSKAANVRYTVSK